MNTETHATAGPRGSLAMVLMAGKGPDTIGRSPGIRSLDTTASRQIAAVVRRVAAPTPESAATGAAAVAPAVNATAQTQDDLAVASAVLAERTRLTAARPSQVTRPDPLGATTAALDDPVMAYRASPALQAEFGSEATYVAFAKAKAAGKVTYFGSRRIAAA